MNNLYWLIVSFGLMFLCSTYIDHKHTMEENAYVCSIDSDRSIKEIRKCFELWDVRIPKGY